MRGNHCELFVPKRYRFRALSGALGWKTVSCPNVTGFVPVMENAMQEFCDSGIASPIIRSDPDYPAEDATMRFHLTYEGLLYGSSTKSPRAKHKQEIRKVFHRQLKRLWEQTWLSFATYGLWEGGQSIPPNTH
jgi:hypothetical protein